MANTNTDNNGTAAVITTPAIAWRLMQIAQVHGKGALQGAYHEIQNILEASQDAEPYSTLADRAVRDCIVDLSMIAFYCAQKASQ